MPPKALVKSGWRTVCVVPAAWLLFFLICANAESDGTGMFWLSVLIVPLMYVGTAAGVIWFVRLWRHRRVFSRLPWLLIVLNAAAVLAGVPMVAGSVPALLGLFGI